MKTIAVIPAHNCAKFLNGLIPEIIRFIPDVLVVDDGSTDNTADTARRLKTEVIRNGLRKGKGAALKTGFQYALDNDYDAVITIDGDGQHKPEYIQTFLNSSIETKADLIIGSRKADLADMPWDRRFSNRCTSKLLSILLKAEIEDSQCGFRLITKRLLENLEFKSDNFELETEMIIKAIQAGFKIQFVPIKVEYPNRFPSYINRLTDTLRWIRLVLELI